MQRQRKINQNKSVGKIQDKASSKNVVVIKRLSHHCKDTSDSSRYQQATEPTLPYNPN